MTEKCNNCGKEIPEDKNDYVYVDETDTWYCDKWCFQRMIDYYKGGYYNGN